MRLLAVTALLLAAVAAGCGSGDGSAAARATTDLTITVWPEGVGAGDAHRWTLRCNPTGGTHPNRARACSRLLSLDSPFKPVPRDAVCTQIYGGPQVAHVRGNFRGHAVDTRFNRVNGCQIARWNRVAVLFPVSVGVTS